MSKKTSITFLFGTYILLLSTNAGAITLKDALQSAYKNSEQVLMQRKSTDLASITRDGAILNVLPTASLSYAKMKTLDADFTMPNTFPNPAGTGTRSGSSGNHARSTTLGLDITLPLSYHKIIPGIYATQKAKNAKEFEYQEFLENFGLMFVDKYMNVIYNERSKDVYEKMSEILEKKVKKAEVMNRYGASKHDQVVVAEAQYYENKAKEIQAQANLDKANRDYKILTGFDPENLEVPSVEGLALPAETQEDFVNIVLAKNNKLHRIEQERLAQKTAMISSAINNLPDFALKYNYTDANMKFDYMGSNQKMKYKYSSIAFGLQWDLKAPNLNKIRTEYKTYRIADLNYSLALKEIEQEANNAWVQYQSMVELFKATQKALTASTNSLKEIKASIATGTASYVDEMEIQNKYLDANLNHLNAQKNLILSYYKLIAMTGCGYLPVV